MAQVVQDETASTDPATQAFIADRQIFWNRFTQFTTGAVIALVLLLIVMWLFMA
ncbi:MAG TPA: hypothetical protein VE650_06240 [Acetobacteraceae bacterium]|jgi:hypothetical protein|nr:hypothetical protein [Acetobacteraceae bacterium]